MQQAELIIAYLKGELQGEQRQEFEQRLSAEPDLRSAVRDYRIILEGFKGLRHESTLQEISGWPLEATPDDQELLLMAYVEGTLDTDAREAFERTMDRDPDLRQRVETQMAISQGFKGLQHEAFAREVKGWAEALPGAETPKETKVVPLKRKSNTWRYAAAAAVLLLIVAAFWLINVPGGEDFSYSAFRQENYIPPVDLTDRGNGEEVLAAAARDFNQGNYAASVEKLRTITSEDSLYVTARYWMGHGFYQLGQYDQAVAAFGQSLEPTAGITYDLRNFSRDNAAWTRILAQIARVDGEEDPGLRRELENFLTDFLENADRSDTYYNKALELQRNLANDDQ
ncbi:hypothetical protein [Flavilitoribacter nigricans]|uniref:Tetratricopeptide repeat protein n=1 Tax=Flavilitoribacter nigricans (strain ATCC 23147 / DSM 23189 / NBRC 102662 / NCIMB 1420 / SS-2) TaxID=1122177 RepID=A0A2D0NB73_FLAN2|nr:hypothetical protein [Flavilitoribacter nigricans]PHN05610.1 hypothetical protein CRP01_16620 [Flavilitoribacter nigricans DSM 23189 = NBRC 102662]